MLEQAHWIALAPLLASVAVLLLGREGPRSRMHWLSIAAMGYAFLHSAAILSAVSARPDLLPWSAALPWMEFGPFELRLGVLIDGPAALMLVVVTLVSLAVQVYSLKYMEGREGRDPRFNRYYAYLSFFTASMLGLVLSSNLLVVFMCWELVGLSSYLLIGFWFERQAPADAAKKAFITTKLGDLGFFLGVLLLFVHAGTLDLVMLRQRFAEGAVALPMGVATAAGLLLLCGAVGKSAQVPLFVWLPDAMEGPTPVSALIHAATMVAAGVYLVARTYFIYEASPVAMEAVAWTGLLTALMAAGMAVVCYDIKRVLAFSTVSQLGYMMLALGVGGYAAGLYHLTTHAFFKALLFLGAGSVIHAMHTNDMRSMGGLSRRMPFTFALMLVATCAIAGVPTFSGFYSKEAVLAMVHEHSFGMWAAAVVTAGLTSFYMFRMMFLTFVGEARDRRAGLGAHESPLEMTAPMAVLAVLAWLSWVPLEHKGLVARLVGKLAPEGGRHAAYLAPAAVAAMAAGLLGAWKLYAGPDLSAAGAIKLRLEPVFRALDNRYGFDDMYLWLVARADGLAAACRWFDDRVVDRLFVDLWGEVTTLAADAWNFFDHIVVDRGVDATGGVAAAAGRGLRSVVRGQVQEYLLYVAVAVAVFAMQLMDH